MTKPTEHELFEKWAIDYGLDWEPNFTRLDVETAWQARAELADKEKAELQAQINELREALEAECGGRCNAEYNPCHARQALAKTAPQCLIEHDNELIERCAKVIEPDAEHRKDASWGYIGGEEGVELLDNAAEKIRKLKG